MSAPIFSVFLACTILFPELAASREQVGTAHRSQQAPSFASDTAWRMQVRVG